MEECPGTGKALSNTGVSAARDFQEGKHSARRDPVHGNWAEVGTVITDPKLGDGGDLEPDSPCIDAGVDIPTVTVDIMGRPRPSPEGGKWDIGPCEFQHEDPGPGPDPEPEPGNELINATFVREVAENVWLILVK